MAVISDRPIYGKPQKLTTRVDRPNRYMPRYSMPVLLLMAKQTKQTATVQNKLPMFKNYSTYRHHNLFSSIDGIVVLMAQVFPLQCLNSRKNKIMQFLKHFQYPLDIASAYL